MSRARVPSPESRAPSPELRVPSPCIKKIINRSEAEFGGANYQLLTILHYAKQHNANWYNFKCMINNPFNCGKTVDKPCFLWSGTGNGGDPDPAHVIPSEAARRHGEKIYSFIYSHTGRILIVRPSFTISSFSSRVIIVSRVVLSSLAADCK